MDKKKLALIIGGIVALLVVVGIVIAVLSNANNSSNQTAAPSSSTAPTQPIVLSIKSSATSLVASQSATLDLYLNTNGAKLDGFQFIASVEGSSTPIITDSDLAKDGIQITAVEGADLSLVNNSVTPQNNAQIVRFSMISKVPSAPFSSTTPVKIASIVITPTAAGTLKLDFNGPNTRANLVGSDEGTLITTNVQAYTVSPGDLTAFATPATATTSGTSIKTTPLPSPTAIALKTTTTATASPSATPKTTPKATAIAQTLATSTPIALATARPASASPSALPKVLPQSGGVSDTIFLIVTGVGFLFLAATVSFAL